MRPPATKRLSPTLALALVSVGAVGLGLSGCRSAPDDDAAPTVRQVAEDMIRTSVSDQAGLGELQPECPEVTGAVPGTTWECAAITADQQRIALSGVVNAEGQVELASTNMVAAAALPSFERAAVDALNTTVGSRLTYDAIDCGQTSVVFVAEPVMICALLDPHTEQLYDVTLDIDDIEARQFSLVVADVPRPTS